VKLAVQPPVQPMLAKRIDALPSGDGLDFEALQLQLHPITSRVNKHASEIGAWSSGTSLVENAAAPCQNALSRSRSGAHEQSSLAPRL
jgi:hypothetical protein